MNENFFSSKSVKWVSPQAFLDALIAEIDFSIVCCSSLQNVKFPKLFAKEVN